MPSTKERTENRQQRAVTSKKIQAIFPAKNGVSGGTTGKTTVDDITELSDVALECRLGHWWKAFEWNRVDTRNGVRIEIKSKCQNCKSVRTWRWKLDGTITQRKYDYSNNYLLSQGTDRKSGVKMQDVRQEIIKRRFK